jgi:hypothetical protein
LQSLTTHHSNTSPIFAPTSHSKFQNGGENQNVCQLLPVKKHGDLLSLDDTGDEEEDDVWTPLLTSNVRVLDEWEHLESDFSKRETISSIIRELTGGENRSLNDIDISTAIDAAAKFSDHGYAVIPDPPVPTDKVLVHEVTVDVDSVCTTFKRRALLERRDRRSLDEIFELVETTFETQPQFFQCITQFSPNSKALIAMPSNGFKDQKTNKISRSGGPTIEIYPKGGYSRIKLPTPVGPEAFKIWIYAPNSLTAKLFVEEVRTVANTCARKLANRYASRSSQHLERAIDKKIEGVKAFDIPGGYLFPISIALLFLENHDDCSFTVETYNCKKKGLRFPMSSPDHGGPGFGSDTWLNGLVKCMKATLKTIPTMLKTFCRLDRVAQIVPKLSKIGFGMEMQYKNDSGEPLYSLCKPDPQTCDRVLAYPMAFLPTDLASCLNFLKNGDRLQTYIPLWNEANFKRIKQDRKLHSNLGLKHCSQKGIQGALNLNVTELLRGAKKEQSMIDNILNLFGSGGYCERVEIAVSWQFTTEQCDGPLCGWNGGTRASRWLDLKKMISECVVYIIRDTKHWKIGPIAAYMSLNFAAALAVYHTSARGMTDTSLLPIERQQLCQTMVFINQLLRFAKDGKLWRNKFEGKLSLLSRGDKCNRVMMLPCVPSRVFSILAEVAGIQLALIPKVLPVTPDKVVTSSSVVKLIDERIIQNTTKSNVYGKRVLQCLFCKRGFYGGTGINNVELFTKHLTQYPLHRISPVTIKLAMTNADWKNDYQYYLANAKQRYRDVYSDAQKRAFDAVMTQQKSVLLVGVAGAGKTMLVQDLRYLMNCVFWQLGEVCVCGATNAVAQRNDDSASTFHSFLGIRCIEGKTGEPKDWNLSVEECLRQMKAHLNSKAGQLLKARVVIVEEGLEVPSNVMEAFFQCIKELSLKIIVIVNGDCCQGTYREDQETGAKQIHIFQRPQALAQLCPTFEIIPFTEDHRTKSNDLRNVKHAVRNAIATTDTENFVKAHQYNEKSTPIDIILCARIASMTSLNKSSLAQNPEKVSIYQASQTSSVVPKHQLNYKYNGVEHVIQLKIGAPIMIIQHLTTTCNQNLQKGTLGIVMRLGKHSVHVQVVFKGGRKQEFEIKPASIKNTHWTQIPVHLAYAGTIAKCIGFEFESIAIDFGIKNEDDCKASWRQKQAYTAISRAKQHCYFIGPAPLSLLNNMDMTALNFFNRQVNLSHQKQSQEIHVVRNVYEWTEFWVQHAQSRRNKRSDRGDADQDNAMHQKRAGVECRVTPIEAKSDSGTPPFSVYADSYPNCFQSINGKGYMLAATSTKHRELLLKKNVCGSKTDFSNEITILRACSDMPGVLSLVATVDDGILLKQMAGRVSWEDFLKKSSEHARTEFCKNLPMIVAALHKRNVAHTNISKKTAWVDMKGTVMLTWFNDAEMPASSSSKQNDMHDMQLLIELVSQRSNQPLRHAVGGRTSVPMQVDDVISDVGKLGQDVSHAEIYFEDLHVEASSISSHQSQGSCSQKCVALQGNLQCITRVDSPITWLVDACVNIGLFPQALQTQHKDEAIAHWQKRDVKYSTRERYKTGGGITDFQFWPDILKQIQRPNVVPSPSSIPMVFTDYGSEFFFQGLLCALLGDFEEVVGIEINADTFDQSVMLANSLMQRAKREDKFISNIQIHQGDFLKHDAIFGITARSTVVYANNVVFPSETNAELVAIWQKHLPAGAAMVLFEETAILSSGVTRISRGTHRQNHWTCPIATMTVSVSWKPGKQKSIHVWQVSPDFTKLRDWAASARFEDLLGWSIFHGRAYLIDGAKRTSLWPDTFAVILDSSSLLEQLSSALKSDTSSIFLPVMTSNEAYLAALRQISSQLQDLSSCSDLHSFCIVDCSEQNPVVNVLMQEIDRRTKK